MAKLDIIVRHDICHKMFSLCKVVVSYPQFEPALAEKMKIQLALQDWEQTMDVAQRYT